MNCHGTGGHDRCLGRLTARLAGLAVVLTAAACSQGAATAVHTASTAKLTVTSTLDRLTALPHRIHWQAFPSAPAADVSEVDYLIDGRQLWTEHEAPYFYGSDGNYFGDSTGISATLSLVPEPSSLTLLGLGFIALLSGILG